MRKSTRATKRPSASRIRCWRTGFGNPLRASNTRDRDSPALSAAPSANWTTRAAHPAEPSSPGNLHHPGQLLGCGQPQSDTPVGSDHAGLESIPAGDVQHRSGRSGHCDPVDDGHFPVGQLAAVRAYQCTRGDPRQPRAGEVDAVEIHAPAREAKQNRCGAVADDVVRSGRKSLDDGFSAHQVSQFDPVGSGAKDESSGSDPVPSLRAKQRRDITVAQSGRSKVDALLVSWQCPLLELHGRRKP